MNIKEALRFAEELFSSFSDEAASEARIVISHLTNIPLSQLAISEKSVDSSHIESIANRRKQGEPLQYIIGKWWFYGGEFFVGEGVLIPRQDTELLVETGLDLIKDIKNPSVIDLCSGSGCIAVSIALERRDAQVSALEKYSEAFAFLEKNISHNNTQNVLAIKGDVLDSPDKKYDLILSNPPYITAQDMKTLQTEVTKEPETALFGGEDGLFFYRQITRVWKSALKSGGCLAFEVGIGQADDVAEIMKSEGFTEIGIKKDFNGVQRVVFGTPLDI